MPLVVHRVVVHQGIHLTAPPWAASWWSGGRQGAATDSPPLPALHLTHSSGLQHLQTIPRLQRLQVRVLGCWWWVGWL
jgi:hypothetical protein